MPEEVGSRVRAALLALADLAPSAEPAELPGTVPLEWFSWLPISATTLFWSPPPDMPDAPPPTTFSVDLDGAYGERLAAVDQIRPEQNSLRVGWLFVAGRVPGGKRDRRVLHPLVSIPVKVRRGLTGRRLVPAGDAELTPFIPDGPLRRRLEASVEYGGGGFDGLSGVAAPGLFQAMPRLQAWARETAHAAGFDTHSFVMPGESPDVYPRRALAIVVGVAAYAVHETGGTNRAASLRTWADRAGDEPTAFHAIYVGAAAEPRERDDEVAAPESPFLLNAVQRRAVAASRDAPVSVVAGAPGTGKSQTVVAIACDALARGETVLVAARSDATVDALLDLLERTPGPEPVVFGSNERRTALAQRLAAGLSEVPRSTVNDTRRALEAAARRRDAVRDALADRVRAHLLANGDPALLTVRDAAPELFGMHADLAEFDRLLRRAGRRGWWGRRGLRRARAAAGAAPDATLADLTGARRLAGAVATAGAATAGAPLPTTPDYGALVAAADTVRAAAGKWLAALAHSESRLDRGARASVVGLATALRSGRAARRAQLARLDRPLTRALPVWVGSLPDIDDLLPQVPALFDLVVLDEASSIDQPLAAPALLRARRAVVVGDPKQLRHVSFLGDVDLRAVLAKHRLDLDPVLATLLDVRRNSVFDVAAGAGPVLTLDEHHRSRPHLVEMVARRVYGGTFAVARRTPLTESIDCIRAELLAGERNKVGWVRAEVDRVVALLHERLAHGARSVGVITPFRPQADALETAVLAAFTADQLQALNLRVGTVHAFQGNERDEVLVSLGIGPAESGMTWRFVEDPHLFAVLTTRARLDVTVLRCADPPRDGLVAGYLAEANNPPGRPPDGPVSPWGAALAAELRRAGADVVTGYPAGRHRVDICGYGLPRPLAVVTDAHPDGPAAHVDRAESLVRTGWQVVEALRRPLATPERVAVELLGRLTP